ncbi:hypothetical protein Hsero_1206 [Herbaspirillum seropedicae SmR1]|uniref:Uncharacterized protein n=1 Tax=Herbaspirillum seropedicae (strain SmR1) TaxID=757424 RepID=D8J1V2_HERSS|nr:hypothetical protein Hsero_1206 [Herbaspirillum seropedicae SmR1]
MARRGSQEIGAGPRPRGARALRGRAAHFICAMHQDGGVPRYCPRRPPTCTCRVLLQHLAMHADRGGGPAGPMMLQHYRSPGEPTYPSITKENVHDPRHHPAHRPYPDPAGRDPSLAAQPQLGLWSQRYRWHHRHHPADPAVAREDIGRINPARDRASLITSGLRGEHGAHGAWSPSAPCSFWASCRDAVSVT